MQLNSRSVSKIGQFKVKADVRVGENLTVSETPDRAGIVSFAAIPQGDVPGYRGTQ